MEKWAIPYLDILINVLILVALILLANFLAKIGVFAPVAINRKSLADMLIAVVPVSDAQPNFTPTMVQVADVVGLRGVQEDIPDRLGEENVVRGELIGFYPSSPEPYARPSTAYEGVIIDVGDRVTLSYKSEWETRLASIPELRLEIISVPESLQVSFEHRPQKIAQFVWRWRVFRKLSRRLTKLQKNENLSQPPCFMCILSRRTARWLTVVPLRAPFPKLSAPD